VREIIIGYTAVFGPKLFSSSSFCYVSLKNTNDCLMPPSYTIQYNKQEKISPAAGMLMLMMCLTHDREEASSCLQQKSYDSLFAGSICNNSPNAQM
jgi:hypothetical protein